MINNKKLNNAIRNNDIKIQKFFDIDKINENHLLTIHGEELYFIRVNAKNISVLSEEATANIIEDLANIIASQPKSEILCLDNFQSYKDNKAYLKNLADTEDNSAIKALNLADIEHLDNVKLNMATSRAFYFLLRLSASELEVEKNKAINSVLQICRENNYTVSLSDKKAIKKLLAIYLEQNTYTEDYPDFDGQQFSEKITPEKYDLHSFVDLVSPSIMKFDFPSYYIIGNTYRTTWAVRQCATVTENLALLKELGEKEGVSLHIYNRVLDEAETGKVFEKAERKNIASLFNSKKMKDRVEGEENLTDMKTLIKESRKTHEAFVHCAVYIEMIAESPEELKNLTISVREILRANKIVRDKLITQQIRGFISVAPFGFNDFGTEFERVMPVSSAANLFPFSYSGKTDRKGIYIGKDVNGSNMVVDFDTREADRTNGHISIFGNSGEGKSYLMKLLMCIFLQQQKKVYSLDIDEEYVDEVKALYGTNLNMMTGKYHINPLQPKIIMESEENDNDCNEYKVVINLSAITLAQHIAYLKKFFKVYCPNLTDEHLSLLEIMLVKTYEKFGITTKTDITKFSNEDFPILSDLYETAEKELTYYDDNARKAEVMIYTKSSLQSLLLLIRSICVGTDSLYFNGVTNIPNSKHVNFVLKGILDVNENLKNTIYLNIFSFMQHKYFTEGRTAVFLDEIHEIINSFIVIGYIRSFIKRGRKKDSNVILASQNVDDLMLPDIIEYTRPLFSIPTYMFMFYPGKVEKESLMRNAQMTEKEYSLIDKSHRGYCFFFCGNEKYHIQIIAPEHKSVLFGTAGGR